MMDTIGSSKQSSVMGADFMQNQTIGSKLATFGFANSVKPGFASSAYDQSKFDEFVNDLEKLRILKAGSLMSNRDREKSLYDYTDAKVLEGKDHLQRHIDGIYNNNTIVVPEQIINRHEHYRNYSMNPNQATRNCQLHFGDYGCNSAAAFNDT